MFALFINDYVVFQKPPTSSSEENDPAVQANLTDGSNTNNTTGGDKSNVTAPPAVDVATPTTNLMATFLEYWFVFETINFKLAVLPYILCIRQFNRHARHAFRSCLPQHKTLLSDINLRFRRRIRQFFDARSGSDIPGSVTPATYATSQESNR